MTATRPALGEKGKVLAQIHIGSHFKNHIHAASAGQFHELFQIIRRAMIEDVMRALFRYHAPARLRATGADDGHSGSARQLHGGDAHAAGCAVNQHSLTRHGAGALKQGAIGRGIRNIEWPRPGRSSPCPADGWTCAGSHSDKFRVSAGKAVADINAVARLERGARPGRPLPPRRRRPCRECRAERVCSA